MSQRCYYKVTDQNSKLFKKSSEFLTMEDELRDKQKKAIRERVPKFSEFRGERGFNRILRYKGFVFEDAENIDPKVWVTKLTDGKLCSTPNKRTIAGKEMDKFLKEFKRTNCWDVDKLLSIEKQSINGTFYPADLFKHQDCIYILIDSQYRKLFEENNTDVIEITYGEMEKAIEEYNKE